MAEMPQAATEETPASPESTTETTEVTAPVSEDAKTQQKSADEKYQETLIALREERSKRKQKDSELEEMKTRLTQLEASREEEEDEPEEEPKARRRQTKAEALSELALKVARDPGFRDRLDLVEEKMSQGMTLEQADNAVLADIARKMMTSSETSTAPSAPNSLGSTAIPEQPSSRPTGNVLKDVMSGKLNIPPEQRAAIARVMEGRTL